MSISLGNAFVLYFKTFKISNLLAFKKHFRIVRENTHASWTLIGKNILLPFVTIASMLVSYNLTVQYARTIELYRYLD